MADIPASGGKGFFPEKITLDQCKDTGMAMVLLCLLAGHFGKLPDAAFAAIVLLFVNMTIPRLFRPVARVWLGFSIVFGTFASKLVLACIFFGIITPVGCIRKMTGKDPLQIKRWKTDEASVFQTRNHTFQPEDMEKPY